MRSFRGEHNGTRPIVSTPKWDASPLPEVPALWDMSHMDELQIVADIRRRMDALGARVTKKGLSRAAGVGDTYVRDILTGRSKNPKTAELLKVLRALDRIEA